MFFPLLDLCHYYAEFSERTDHDFPSAAEIIEAYSHYGLKIHFSYSIGNGRGVNHGHDYSTNPELCRNILREIRKCDSSAALILEVREDDYIKAFQCPGNAPDD
jgi:hypothetical protein